MAILTNYDEFLAVKSLDVKDVFFVTGKEPEREVEDQDIIGFVVSNNTNQEKVFDFKANEIIDKIVTSMNDIANVETKGHKFIEPNEIATIKNTLVNYEARIEKLIEIKKELEKFEDQIKTNYTEKIREQKHELTSCEEQIEMLENTKEQFIKQRLSRFLWPYDAKTKRCDLKIAALKTRIKKCALKIDQLSGMRPAADEKDILLFQMQLKNKFVA